MAILSRLTCLGNRGFNPQLIVIKRWSGHNAMNIAPSSAFGFRYTHNWMHFYFILAVVPLTLITAIADIRSNPELIEPPDGYEPRHWEYYKNPITRAMAKYLYGSVDLDREVDMANREYLGADYMRKKISDKCDRVMAFYNDHRSIHFVPYFAEQYRQGRDFAMYKWNFEKSEMGENLDLAYSQTIRPVVPVEGYTQSDSSDE